MLKKLLILLLFVAPFGASAQTAIKFAVVDVQAIFNLMPEREAAQKEYEAIQGKYEGELSKLGEEYQKKFAEYSTQADSVPESIKVRRMQEVAELEGRIQKFREVAVQEMSKKQNELLAPIFTKLNNTIKEVGVAGGYTMVFNSETEGAILYTAATVDNITDKVKAKLNLK